MTESTRACDGGSRRKHTCLIQGEARGKAGCRYTDTVDGGTQATQSLLTQPLAGLGEAELSLKPRYWRDRVAPQGGPQPSCSGNESQLRCLPWFANSQNGSLMRTHCCPGVGWEPLWQAAPKARPVLQEETASCWETTSGEPEYIGKD